MKGLRLAIALSFLLAAAAAAQTPPPVVKPPEIPPFDGRQGYVVYPDTMDVPSHEEAAECVARALAQAVPAARVLPPERFRDAFYPWMEPATKPRNQPQQEEWLKRPLVQARAREIGLRYLVIVHGRHMETSIGVGHCGINPCPGRGIFTSHAEVSLSIWDIEARDLLGRAEAEAEEKGFEGVLVFIPINISPDTAAPVCAEAAAAAAKAMAAGTPR